MDFSLPDIKSGDVIPADWLTKLKTEVELQSRMVVAPPFRIIDGPGGRALVLDAPNNILRSVIPLKLVSVETGAGWYGGVSLTGKTGGDPSVDLAMPLDLDAAADTDLLVANPADTSGHDLSPSSDNPIFTFGVVIGFTDESESRRIVLLPYAKGSPLPGDRLRYKVLQITTDDFTPVWDYPRFA